MKKFVIVGMIAISSLFAQDLSSAKDKIYLNSSEIRIAVDKIFVLVNNNWIQTQGLHSDSSGTFVRSEQFLPWFCERCQQWTNGWWVCEHCGNPK